MAESIIPRQRVEGLWDATGKMTTEYRIWASMKNRCMNPKNYSYQYYGGRGIGVCPRWADRHGFANFLLDMGKRPDGMTLDRINNDGNYEPGNVRWATSAEQGSNMGFAYKIEVRPGVFWSARRLAKYHGYYIEQVIILHERGYPAEEIVGMLDTYKDVRTLLKEYAKKPRTRRKNADNAGQTK